MQGQSNLAITNSTGPSIFVRYNREALYVKVTRWTKKSQFLIVNLLICIITITII
jgi:hypothetical protein